MSEKKHIHFIGICGVAMSALALTFKERGWKVTGSDKGFFPPISTHLEQNGIDFYAGWHPEKMGTPDLVVVGNVAGSENPEWLYIQEKNIPYKSYPEVVGEYFVRPNSIVCAGTYGKTTCTALLSWIYLNNGYNPNYMFGGLSQNKLPAAHLTESKWSILEGDEYKSARWDNRPKFSHYNPKYLLLTAVVWDHADIYKTEEDYHRAFQKLANELPDDGLVIVSERVDSISFSPKIITYGKSKNCSFRYGTICEDATGLKFNIYHDNKSYFIESPCLGEYMADNITGCFALAFSLGIEAESIIENIKTFLGMKRRLEKRFEGKIDVFDDIAHSPAKVKSVIETLRRNYPDKKLIIIFEPNTGNRRPEAIPGYDKAFLGADEVIIPRLTKIKHTEGDDEPIEGTKLTKIIAKTHKNVKYFENDGELVRYLLDKNNENVTIAFLGSHGFRGMIEDLVKNLD
ncbi:MAG: Mur ligase domain-containing protein [Patescibacteria group bacterium]|jgi:UDP-N-acetylmuramate: L-alanyl-gamma-D-glutamyl-meso-diaminopimelate ligase